MRVCATQAFLLHCVLLCPSSLIAGTSRTFLTDAGRPAPLTNAVNGLSGSFPQQNFKSMRLSPPAYIHTQAHGCT